MDLSVLFIIAAAIAVFVSVAFEVVKQTFNIASRFLPIAAIAVGIFVAIILQPFTVYDLYTMVIAGAMAGLSACGLFDLKKSFGAHVKGGNTK